MYVDIIGMIIGAIVGIGGTLLYSLYSEKAMYKKIIYKEKIDRIKELLQAHADMHLSFLNMNEYVVREKEMDKFYKTVISVSGILPDEIIKSGIDLYLNLVPLIKIETKKDLEIFGESNFLQEISNFYDSELHIKKLSKETIETITKNLKLK